ncbi:MAG: UvrD-helicase domain-containing protein [Planctomycetaceae bacterium]|jgi:ATP-dependent exoDNAse (exonuclease V) beta subunit|nr:UvrD-helicase domain-containing protein [Planctomycetaceae bacterium]
MPNIVIQASAGSGKTMQLSNSFLGILFTDVDVDTILASTFTRKAAGEITDRILNRLANALAGNNDEKNNLKNLMPHEILNNAKNPDDYADTKLFQTLAKLVRNLYKVRICTLDSFFSRIASTFFLELGFPSGWSIIPDNDFEKIINEAIRNVLENSEKNHARKIMHAIQQDDQDINVTKKLRELARDVIPLVRESTPEAWNNNELLSKELENAEFEFCYEQLKFANLPVKKDGTTLVTFDKAHKKIIEMIDKNDWINFLRNGFVQKIITKENKYYSNPIDGDLHAAISKFIVHARAVELNKIVGITTAMRELFDLIAEGYDKITTRDQVLQFNDVTNRLGDLFKSQNNKSDFQALFKSILHRTNFKMDHLLLDEFQDTSKSQWNILEPFVRQVAANSAVNTFLCVGDAKQAIYGWRGGVSEIFNEINSVAQNIEEYDLMKSYRSCQVVIDVVNRVFANIDLNAALENFHNVAVSWKERMKPHETARKELDGYCLLEVAPDNIYNNDNGNDIDSDTAVEKDGEYDDDGDVNLGYAGYVVKRIIEINERRPDCSIGILVTKNAMIAELMNEFRRRNISASEEGGNTIVDSAAVQCVLSAMQLADHPDDGVARFHLVNSPLATAIKLTKYDDDKHAAEVALKLRREIMEDGYGKIIERFAEALAPFCNQREYQRLEKLLELAYQFQETATGARTKQFISMINNTKVESPNATDNIRIMTIHKSKGMQFDIVVLPDINGTLAKSEKTPQFIAGRKNAVADIDVVIKYLNKEMQALLPEEPNKYRKAFADYIEGNIKESLSVLYVAMTRAIHELVMIAKPPKKTTKQKKDNNNFPATFEGVLRASLQNGQNLDNTKRIDDTETKSQILYETGNINWSKPQKKKITVDDKDKIKTDEVSDKVIEVRVGAILSDRKKYRHLLRIIPSRYNLDDEETAVDLKTDSVLTDDKITSGEILTDKYLNDEQVNTVGSGKISEVSGIGGSFRLSRESAMLRGKMIHACFENWLKRVNWLDGVEVDRNFLSGVIDEVVRKEGYVGVRERDLKIDRNVVIKSFIEICEKPEIRNVLSRSRYASKNVEVQHERWFTVFLGNDRGLMRGSLDRIVVEREAGKIVNIEVLDFKTDRIGNNIDEKTFLKQRKQEHAKQMKAYRKGIEQLYKIEQNKINITLVFTNIGKVIPAF